jgi:hypothetical protein
MMFSFAQHDKSEVTNLDSVYTENDRCRSND